MNNTLMNSLIGEGKFTEALNVVKEDIALPYILGYICPAPCEKACRRKQIDDPVSVCLLKRFSAENGMDEKAIALKNSKFRSGKNVAIIGSGPAGLAAAYYLLLHGHACTIYDKSPEPGGTMRYSIPDEELPKSVIDREVEIIRSMGGEFILNTLISKHEYENMIAGRYDSVVIATGDKSVNDHLEDLFSYTKTGYQVNESDMSASMPGFSFAEVLSGR
jgi:NADPH-dependent glutamate synthase beta subunit-like oxidoreductase